MLQILQPEQRSSSMLARMGSIITVPRLIKLATLREEKSLKELAGFVKDYGRRNISVAREILPEEDS